MRYDEPRLVWTGLPILLVVTAVRREREKRKETGTENWVSRGRPGIDGFALDHFCLEMCRGPDLGKCVASDLNRRICPTSSGSL
jgi:hypothetical protein